MSDAKPPADTSWIQIEVPGGILRCDRTLTDAELADLKARWQETAAGLQSVWLHQPPARRRPRCVTAAVAGALGALTAVTILLLLAWAVRR